jgi:hypothetical protein
VIFAGGASFFGLEMRGMGVAVSAATFRGLGFFSWSFSRSIRFCLSLSLSFSVIS